MTLPSFLKRCNKFPRSAEDREDDCWLSPSRGCHRVWGTAFELSVSYEALLQTDNAAERLFKFVDASYQCEAEEDYGEDKVGENSRQRCPLHDKIIWMSSGVFITRQKSLGEALKGSVPGTTTLFRACSLDSTASFWTLQQPSIASEQTAAIESDTPSPRLVVVDTRGMDVILRLLAKHTAVTDLMIQAHRPIANGDKKEFPASLGALQDFVGKARTERSICLQAAGLSQAQWNVVTSNSNKNAMIQFIYSSSNSGRTSFPEAAMLNHCPSKLGLGSLELASADKLQMVLRVLESTTVLEELHISIASGNKECFLLCMNAISRNRSLKTFHFSFDYDNGPRNDLTLEEWEFGFCRAVLSHPTIQNLKLFFSRWGNCTCVPSPEKDDILIQVLSQNKVLCKLDTSGVLDDEETLNRVIGPLLRFNRHQLMVQAIKRETDTAYRQKLFMATLFSHRVYRRQAYQYLLFKENFDLWLKPSPSFMEEGKLGSDREMTMRQNEMKKMSGRKPKRSRSS